MNHHDHAEGLGAGRPHRAHPEPQANAAARRSRWVFGGFAAIAVVLFALEHRAHLLGWLPWLFLLACPLMHRFMHGGQGHGGRGHGVRAKRGDEP